MDIPEYYRQFQTPMSKKPEEMKINNQEVI